MQDIRVMRMESRHVKDASRFIAEVLEEEENITVRGLERYRQD